MDRFRVLIAGGGIAAVEGVLRLRRLVADAVDITLLAPNDELRYRPVAVQEPFSRPSAKRYPLREVARKANADWVQDALEWVDPDAQAFCVLFTTQPQEPEGRFLARLCNAVAAALE